MPLLQRKTYGAGLDEPMATIEEAKALLESTPDKDVNHETKCQYPYSVFVRAPPRRVVATIAAFFAMYMAGCLYYAVSPDGYMYYVDKADKIFTRIAPRGLLMSLGIISRTQNFEKDFDAAKVLADFMDKRERMARELEEGGAERECLDIGTSHVNKKLAWRMKHDRRPILGLLADKATVKLYAEAMQLEYPENIYVGGCDEIPNVEGDDGLKDLAFKASHSSGCNMVVKDGTIIGHKICLASDLINGNLKGKKVTNALLKDQCSKWLSHTYSVTEWAYMIAKPTIVIEKLIPEAVDLKCYTFDGKTEHVCVYRTDQKTRKMSQAFYDGETFEIRSKPFDSPSLDSPPSDYLSKSIIEKAVNLCNHVGFGLDFARVDLMMMAKDTLGKEFDDTESAIASGVDEDNLYFQLGEMTMYPSSAAQHFRARQAAVYGSKWCLPKEHGPDDV